MWLFSNTSVLFTKSPRLLFVVCLLQQYLSPEHAKAMSGNNSQGPVYKVYVSTTPGQACCSA